MRFFKRIAGLLGLGKDEDQHHRDGDASAEAAAPPPFSAQSAAAATASAQHLPRRGFSVPVQVPVERGPPAPLLLFCPSGDGGVQLDVLELNAMFPTCDVCLAGFHFKSESTYLLAELVSIRNVKSMGYLRIQGKIRDASDMVWGLRWYARRLKMDEDGDVADEFLDEVSPDTLRSVGAHKSPAPRFEVKNSTKPVKVRNLELLPNGKIQHLVEHHGKLEWL
ncbi:hypothetical protein SASPL_148276 [Salvia splendens]|uniref:Uncharacterized protein n=1 Tax=Salvia splendens TaxID=180675 RepID=A0A8X8Z3Y6_SALSN|nr:hypothetical protein SASPL_148276 [Salvia splendens]